MKVITPSRKRLLAIDVSMIALSSSWLLIVSSVCLQNIKQWLALRKSCLRINNSDTRCDWSDLNDLAMFFGSILMTKSPDFQKTLKRMLETPPKENKPLNANKKSDKKTKPSQ